MRFARFNGEVKDIRDVVRGLYEIHGRGSAERFRRAEESLLAANPFLDDLSSVKKGTILRVPEIAPIKPTSELRPLQNVVNTAIQSAQLQLERVEARLEEKSIRLSDDAQKTLELSRSKKLQVLAENNSSLKRQLPEIRKAVEARVAGLKHLKTSRKKGFSFLKEELARLNRIGKNEVSG